MAATPSEGRQQDDAPGLGARRLAAECEAGGNTIKALAGRFKELNPALVVLAAIFIAKFAFGVNA